MPSCSRATVRGRAAVPAQRRPPGRRSPPRWARCRPPGSRPPLRPGPAPAWRPRGSGKKGKERRGKAAPEAAPDRRRGEFRGHGFAPYCCRDTGYRSTAPLRQAVAKRMKDVQENSEEKAFGPTPNPSPQTGGELLGRPRTGGGALKTGRNHRLPLAPSGCSACLQKSVCPPDPGGVPEGSRWGTRPRAAPPTRPTIPDPGGAQKEPVVAPVRERHHRWEYRQGPPRFRTPEGSRG